MFVDTESGGEPCVQLQLNTSNDALVRAVVVFAEGIFVGESLVLHPSRATCSATVRLRLDKEIPADLHVKALVGYENR